MLHEFENNLDTQEFLKSNGKKFNGDCLIAMKLMYQGLRLNSETCWNVYHIHDRRLRNCREARPDIVKSDWVRDEKGKRKYVEYWIDKPKVYPTKTELNQWFDEFQNGQHDTRVISIDRNKFIQQSLFNE